MLPTDVKGSVFNFLNAPSDAKIKKMFFEIGQLMKLMRDYNVFNLK